MRKHFLLLMLTALLPLVAWAQADPATKTAPAGKANLVYNGAEQELVTAAVLKDDATEGTEIYYAYVANGEAAPIWPSTFATTLPKVANAGSYDVYYLTRLSSVNSNIVKAATVDVAKADLLVKAKDVTHYYTGVALTTGTGLEIIYDGWKGNDEANQAAILSGKEPTLTTTQTAVGSYTITLDATGKVITNYNFVPVSGTMTIVKRKVQIAATDKGPFGYGTADSKDNSWTVAATKAGFDAALTLHLQNNNVGDAESFGAAEVLADDAAVTGWFQAKDGNLKGFTLTRNGDNSVGEYVLTPAGATIVEAKKNQYEFVYKTGLFTISTVDVTVTPANGTKVYGDKNPEKYPFNVDVATLTAEEKAQIVTARTAGEPVGTYDITVSGPATINGYNVTYDNAVKGKFMITQRPVTVTALPQLLYTGNTASDLNVAEVYVEGILDGDPDIEVALSLDETILPYDGVINVDGDHKLTSTVDTKTVPNFIVPALKAGKEYPNYKFNFVKGSLVVVNLATVMLLTDTDASLTDKLTAANGEPRNVSFGSRTLKAETWNVLVLPFKTCVKDISEAFGYAVVDILDETASDGNIHLKLWMGDIPANTPFIVKNYDDKDLKSVLFAGKKIEYTAAGENVFVEDAAGNKFFGTYKTTEVYGSNIQYMTGSGVFKDAGAYTADKKLTLKPLRAYLQTVAQNNAGAAPMIYIEEPDGSTTAIETVSAVKAANGNDAIFNLAGQKVGADYKGIVIKNGKRFVQK